MSGLNAFCNQLIAFFEDLKETYPEEKDIANATQTLKLLKRANPRLIHRAFMTNIYTEFSQHILNEDEDYILMRAKEILSSEYAEINFAFWIFDKHWRTMTETNKQHVWRHIKTLILLAQKV